MSADDAASILPPFAERPETCLLRGYGIVHDIDRAHAEPLENTLRAVLMTDMADANRIAPEGLAPVELLLGIDDHDEFMDSRRVHCSFRRKAESLGVQECLRRESRSFVSFVSG